LGNTDLGQAKAQVGGRIFLKGNMNAVQLLAAGSSIEVREQAARCLRVGGPGGGYILSTACSVPPRTQPWKLEMLVPLAEELGRYGPAPA
jgi:uroporphyrinogen-III decarboxylase